MDKRGPVAVKLDNEIITYSADITVGSNNQKLSVIVDTGSSDLWIPDSKAICIPKWRGDRGDFCKNNGSYSPAASSTSKNLNTRFEIKYADGSYAKVTCIKIPLVLVFLLEINYLLTFGLLVLIKVF